jgi:DNA mismatch endonuclease (patch repair protein)
VADVYTKSKRSEIMSRVRNKQTQPEDIVASILQGLGVKYERNVRTLPGQPDLAIRSRKVAIFVNGCFWHGHRNCPRAKLPQTNVAFWMAKIEINKRRDRRAARSLRQKGWHVITIWQCRLRKPDRVRVRLAKRLRRGRMRHTAAR